ncbi:hypothetical protein GW17_00048077 [Ensete ventricosum]|nr:hypothetical protein GW17_00048077 [Ensete ventricosum]
MLVACSIKERRGTREATDTGSNVGRGAGIPLPSRSGGGGGGAAAAAAARTAGKRCFGSSKACGSGIQFHHPVSGSRCFPLIRPLMEADSTGSAVGPPAAEDSSSPDVDADALAFPRGLLYPFPWLPLASPHPELVGGVSTDSLSRYDENITWLYSIASKPVGIFLCV